MTTSPFATLVPVEAKLLTILLPCDPVAPMVDTNQVRHRIEMFPEETMRRIGFWKLRQPAGIECFVLNPWPPKNTQPRLTWSKTMNGDWLTAECSLPMLLFG